MPIVYMCESINWRQGSVGRKQAFFLKWSESGKRMRGVQHFVSCLGCEGRAVFTLSRTIVVHMPF
jgi:hypothetical protein